jgi:hypothetical protein
VGVSHFRIFHVIVFHICQTFRVHSSGNWGCFDLLLDALKVTTEKARCK